MGKCSSELVDSLIRGLLTTVSSRHPSPSSQCPGRLTPYLSNERASVWGWGDNSGQYSGCLFPALMQQSFPSGDCEACPEPSSQVTTPQPSLWQPHPLPQCLLLLLFESHFLRELTAPWSVPQCPTALSCPPGTLAWNERGQKSQVRHSEALGGEGLPLSTSHSGSSSEHFSLWEQ